MIHHQSLSPWFVRNPWELRPREITLKRIRWVASHYLPVAFTPCINRFGSDGTNCSSLATKKSCSWCFLQVTMLLLSTTTHLTPVQQSQAKCLRLEAQRVANLGWGHQVAVQCVSSLDMTFWWDQHSWSTINNSKHPSFQKKFSSESTRVTSNKKSERSLWLSSLNLFSATEWTMIGNTFEPACCVLGAQKGKRGQASFLWDSWAHSFFQCCPSHSKQMSLQGFFVAMVSKLFGVGCSLHIQNICVSDDRIGASGTRTVRHLCKKFR